MKDDWYRWFAWWPVRYQETGKLVWFKPVMRREVYVHDRPLWSLYEDPELVAQGLDRRSKLMKRYPEYDWGQDVGKEVKW